MHDAGDGGAVFGSHNEHETPVAFAHHLFLQIPRRLAATQIGFQIASQAVALFTEATPNRLQLRTRVVRQVAGRVNFLAHIRALTIPVRGAADNRRQGGVRSIGSGGHRPADPLDRPQEGDEADELRRFQRMCLDHQRIQGLAQILRGFEGERAVRGREPNRLCGVCQRGPYRPRVGQRAQPM